MKRMLTLLLTGVLLLSLAACGQPAAIPAPTEASAAQDSGLISTVDELLAAITPGAEIVLAPGEYRLDTAADYGASASPYYTWNNLGLGQYELQLNYVNGLTIRGSGKDLTTLVCGNAFANIISLKDCANIALENMTLGHTEMVEACQGGVIRLDNADNTRLKGLGLFGCGSVGVSAYDSQDVVMDTCEVYECSVGGIQLSQCRGISILNSEFRNLGKEMPVMDIFSVNYSQDILIENCSIHDNYAETFLFGGGYLTMRGNTFKENRISSAAFSIHTPDVVLEDNEFENNEMRNWYTVESLLAVDANGNELPFTTEEASPLPITPGEAVSVTTGEQQTVRVRTADDFLEAIAPDTCIILDTALLDLSQAQSYKNAKKEFGLTNEYQPTYQEEHMSYCYWMNNYDGPSLIINGVSNLTIQAEGSDRTTHTISATPRYADVLTFENCSSITLSGFTAGHTKEPGQCTGGVFLFQNCADVLVDNCGMYGCGTEGVCGISSRNIQVVNSEIYECSYTGIQLDNCENVAISGTIIRDISNEWQGDAPHFTFYASKNITLDGFALDGNYTGN